MTAPLLLASNRGPVSFLDGQTDPVRGAGGLVSAVGGAAVDALWVCAALTEIAGCSDVFEAGYVTYSNAAKTGALKVSGDVIDTFGAVSIAAAWAMARGALAASGADVAVAITGIAGPDGGTPGKPVGTVVFALAERTPLDAAITADSKHFDAAEGRSGIRLAAALCALELLLPQPDAATAAVPGTP